MHIRISIVAEHPIIHQLHLSTRLAVNIILILETGLRLLLNLIVVFELRLLLDNGRLEGTCGALWVNCL